ncbi:MAG: hypothetical protein AAF664_19275 [Planctomycetota bacterium]
MGGNFFDSDRLAESNAQPQRAGDTASTRFLGIMFECCSVYGRIYRDAAGTSYQGNCPKCAKKLTVGVGSGGTDQRFFRAQ